MQNYAGIVVITVDTFRTFGKQKKGCHCQVTIPFLKLNRMTNINTFPGNYSRSNNNLKKNDTELLIFDRKNTTPKKPQKFIVLRDSKGLKKYISSLYPIDEPAGKFKFDYLARVYHLHLQDETATIQEIPRQNRQSDNVVSLSDFTTICSCEGIHERGVK